MRILVSAVGTRGDVQPATALAVELRRLGHAVQLCVPPNFVDEVARLGFAATSIGVEMRAPPPGATPSPAISAADLITGQFGALAGPATGCDLIVGAGLHQYAARSIAELRGIAFVVAVYAPVSLPSPDHPPPGPAPSEHGAAANLQAWSETRRSWNNRALEPVNANRTALGLPPIDDVLTHILGETPWLAADATLGPAPSTSGFQVVQTGAWILPEARPLPRDLEAFLDGGDPPLYLGFGSMPASGALSLTLIEAVRGIGRRAILSKGWADLGLPDNAPDCIAVGDVNHQLLFPRVAAVLHHGGAGTTLAAALAGKPQIVTPMFSDQFYWAERVRELNVGSSLSVAALSVPALTQALKEALNSTVVDKARLIADKVSPEGAAIAAARLTKHFG